MAINFPNSPSSGDVLGNYTYDSSIPGWRKTPENSASLPAGTIVQWPGATAPANWLVCDGSAISRTTYASLFNAIGIQYGAGDGVTTFNLPNLKGRVAVGLDSSQTEFDTLGETGGAKTHTLTESELPSHTHSNALSNATVASSSHRHNFAFVLLDKNWSPVGQNAGMDAEAANAGGAYKYSNNTYNGGTSIGNHTTNINTNINSGSFTSQTVGRYRSVGDTDTPSATTTVGITNGAAGSGAAHNNLQPYIVLNYIIKTSAGVTSGDSELLTRLATVENKFNTGQNDAPAGSITEFAGSTIPTNWLLCDGSAVSRATWPSLFAAIGTTYGAGDGTTTFNVPNIPAGSASGVLAKTRLTGVVNVSATSMTDITGLSIANVSLKAGRAYKISWSASQTYSSSASNRFRLDYLVNGVVVGRHYMGYSGAYGEDFYSQAIYTPTTDLTNVTVKLQGAADIGGGTFTWYADVNSPMDFTIEDIGYDGSALRPRAIIKATAGVSTNDSTFVTRVGAAETSINALQVAAATTNLSGLVPVFPTSVSVGSGSATVSAVGVIEVSAASSVSLNGIFNDPYGEYVMQYTLTTSANTRPTFRARIAGSDDSGNVYYGRNYTVEQGSASAGGSTATLTYTHPGTGAGSWHFANVRFFKMYDNTAYGIMEMMGTGSYGSVRYGSVQHQNPANVDGLTLYPESSGTITGRITIFKYRK